MLKTKARISDAEIMNAAKILTQSKGNLYVCGSASGAPLAKYFYLLSKYIRKNSILLSPDISTLTHHLTDVAEDDTLLIIAHKRHAKPSVQVAQWFKSCNSKIVFITDRETSPLAKISDINLFVSSEGPAMFNSRVVTLLLLESLLEAMIFFSGEEVEKRLIRFEELFEKLGVYSV
ncbi:MurR/RpiR family transcriptional regulator [Pelovirga terrestris]|uniref:MurR/RpiR family transcriptional regulator n=1 Tax=Pelovirga terrestris TaxID=2771352 RepID=A0A8J6URJ5_9BACT|nr:SIS domain-containing protein [Pelovirga terrestris]MBD1401476.1 MurR/RpiR family transcriptional regulator [Pelovirga terrestris]